MEVPYGLELRETRPRLWSAAFSVSVGVVTVLAAAVATYTRSIGGSIRITIGDVVDVRLVYDEIGVYFAMLVVGALLMRWLLRLRPPRVVRLAPAGLLVPSVGLRRYRVIAYPEIVSLPIQRVAVLQRTLLSIGWRRRGPLMLSDRRFESADEFRSFRDALLSAIEHGPGGPDQRAQVEGRFESDRQPFRIPWLSIAIVCAMSGLYWTTRAGPSMDPAWDFTRALVAKGELFRLVTGSWLHSDLSHLAGNSTAILLFGTLGERALGWQRMLGVGVASSVVAYVAMLLVPGPLYVSTGGMSAWAFGWAGGWLWLRGRHGSTLPPLLQSRVLIAGAWLVPLLHVARALARLQQGAAGISTADAAHAAGFVTGIALTALATRRSTRELFEPVTAPAARWIVWGSAGLLCGSLVWGLQDATSDEDDAQWVLERILEEHDDEAPDSLAMSLNNAAWRAATHPNPSPEWLRLAHLGARRALSLAGDPPDSRYFDTLATVRYRLGDLESAVELAWRAAEVESDPERQVFHRSQAGRFELARSRKSGALRVGEAPHARLELALDQGELQLAFDGPSSGPLLVHGVALREEGLCAYIRAHLPGPLAAAESSVPLPDYDLALLGDCDEIVTTRVQAQALDSPEPRVSVDAFLEEVLELP